MNDLTAHKCFNTRAHFLISANCYIKTSHLEKGCAGGMNCRYRRKVFNRAFNLRRHKKILSTKGSEKMFQSDSDSQGMHFENNVSTSSTDESESSMSTESEAETEKEYMLILHIYILIFGYL